MAKGYVMEKLIESILFIGTGVFTTLQLLVGGLLIGAVLGTGIAILRYRKILLIPLNCFVSIIRGTPLLLQLGLFYFAVPGLISMRLSVTVAGLITLGLNSSAYIAEILRAGIESLPKGQFEAAQTLRIPNYYMWKDIVLPQVVRNVFPAMVSETISLLKETALVATLGGTDLMRKAQTLAAEQFTYFTPLCIAAGYYYIMILCIEYLGRRIERRTSHAYHS
jgi:polar amino acid transport system permease protein